MKRLYLLLIIGFVLSAGLGSALTVEDDFDRANSDTLGTATNGNTWTENDGGDRNFEINNNELLYDYTTGSSSVTAYLELTNSTASRIDVQFYWVGAKGDSDFNFYTSTTNTGSDYGPYVGSRGSSELGYFDGGSWTSLTGSLTTDAWHNLSFRDIDSVANTYDIYLDGSQIANDIDFRGSGDTAFIGITGTDGGDWRLDNLTTGDPEIVNFSISAQDAFSGASINNFTAVITSISAGYNKTWNTTNGTITTDILKNSSFLYNITVSADNYFNRTRTNYNVSTDLVAQLAQARATFDAYEKVSGNEVFNFNITINGSTYNSTETFALSAGTYNATFSKSGYYDKTREITVVAEEVQLYNFTDVYNHRANFTIDVLSGSATDQNFTIDIYSDDHSFSEKLSTTTGNILANLTHGNYTVWLNDSYHALQNYSVELNSSTNLTQVTLDSYTTNTVSIRFLDEETNNLINDRNITAYFTGSIISYNRTTSNGTMVLEMINPQEYEITYNADGYSQRKYTFTLTNRTFNELDLYLINETQDELILTSVQDSFLDPVPNAVIRAQKKNLSGTNYYTVETCTTDNNGECLLHLVLYDTTYRFLIDVDGNTVLTSADQTIKQSTLSFRVNLEQDTLEDINNILGITGSLFYDKANSNIEFTWNDQNSLGVTACLDIDTRQGSTTSDYNLSCTTSASGTIILPIDTNLSVTYEAVGYVLVDGQRYDLDTISVAGNTFGSGMGLNGLFIFGFIVVGIAAFTGLWNPVVGPITTAAVIWFFNYIGFITVGTAAVTSLIIGAIMVAYLSKS